MAGNSSNSSSSFNSGQVSSKPWFLTYDKDNKDIFLWRNGSRLKLNGNQSAGSVSDVSVADESERVLMVSQLATWMIVRPINIATCVWGGLLFSYFLCSFLFSVSWNDFFK